MSEVSSDLKRVLSSGGIYAVASIAQQGLAFFMLPIYTRFIEPAEFGVLELLTAFSFVVFGILSLGLPSAINKCYHRDCQTPGEQARILSTSICVALPLLLAAVGILFTSTPTLGRWIGGSESVGSLVRLVLVTGVLTNLSALVLSSLRAQERAIAFSTLTLTQFAIAISLNIVLVVAYGMGVHGVLWGNLVSNAIALPLSMLVVWRRSKLAPVARLARPLLSFGLLLIPVILAGWVMDLSDRYVLRLYSGLEEVAVYGVGYKLARVVQFAIVWPFQLGWPAVSFSISSQEGHRDTYARVLTYLCLVLVFSVLAVSFVTRIAISGIVGEGFHEAYRVVPFVALAYTFNGIQFCVSPGVHLSGRTRYLSAIALSAAVLNLALNFLLIPRWGMMGAGAATAASFLLVALLTGAVSQRFYPVDYEYRRLGKLFVAGLVIFTIGVQVPPEVTLFSVSWHLVIGIVALPVVLLVSGFVEDDERRALRGIARRFVPFGAR